MSDPTAAEPKGYFGIEGAPMTGADPKDEQVERQAEYLRSQARRFRTRLPDQCFTVMNDAAVSIESQARTIATLTAERDRAVEILKLVADMDDADVPALWNYSSILERARDFLAASQPSMPPNG